MIFAFLLMATAASAAGPTDAEAIALGREVARSSLLATLVPLKTASELDEIIAANPDLTPAEKGELRRIGTEHADALLERVLEVEGRALAANLSVEDLRVLDAFERSTAGRNRRAAMVSIIMTTVAELDGVDYGSGVKASFCRQTGKLCGPPAD